MKKIHYGWFVVAASCAIIAMTSGIITNCFSQFIKPVCADMGFTRQQMSMNQTIVSVIGMGFGLVWGAISRRINLHRWMCAAALLLPVCYFCYSFAPDLTAFYAVTVVLSLVFCFISMMLFTYIVGNWFVKNRGTALGLASMGSGIGAMVMNSVINWLILSYGWRSAYQISAVLMFAVVVPLTFFVLRVRPEDKGLRPYGAGEQTASGKPVTRFEGFAYREVIRMPLFYVVGAISVTQVMAICVFYQTVAPHLSDMGYTSTFAATMASITMGALAVGKIILGKLFDRFGTRRAAVTACTCTLLGLVGMIFCTFKPALALIVLGVGLGCSFGAVCMPLIVQNIFGMKDYNAVYGKLTACTGVGSAVAPVLSGRVFDTCGSYLPIYIAAALAVACAIVVLWKNLPDRDNVRG